MAVEPANLIQIQSRLQDPSVRNEDLLKYANNSNPEVPSFLALIEMNRRKQIANTANAFNQSSAASIKDQVASELTQPNQIGVGATANPFKANITGDAPGVNLAGNPGNVDMTQEPTGIRPTANPALPGKGVIKPITGAAGGLMSIPVGHFKEQSYAGGGIVAFGDPARNPYETQLVSEPQSREPGKQVLTEEEIMRELERASQAGKESTAAPVKRATGYEGIRAALPQMTAPTEKSLEELAAERKAVEKLAGVSDDPYADSKKRMAAMEARQGKINEDAGLARLVAQLSAFATADPAKGIGYAGAVSAQASQELEDKQNALRDKQETAQIEFARAVEKEENARRLKDADGIQAAQAAQEKAKFDYQKAEHDRGMLAAHIYQTDEYAKMRRDAAAQAAANKPDPDDVLFNRIMAKAAQDPAYKAQAKKLEMMEVGTPEYDAAMEELYRISEPYFAKRPDLMPPKPTARSSGKPAEQPGWWDRNMPAFLGGSPTVSFDKLPK